MTQCHYPLLQKSNQQHEQQPKHKYQHAQEKLWSELSQSEFRGNVWSWEVYKVIITWAWTVQCHTIKFLTPLRVKISLFDQREGGAGKTQSSHQSGLGVILSVYIASQDNECKWAQFSVLSNIIFTSGSSSGSGPRSAKNSNCLPIIQLTPLRSVARNKLGL